MSRAGRAPDVRATSRPAKNTAIVGIDRIVKRSPSSGSASVLTFTTTYRPALLAATLISSGATRRHGPHHGAQKSTTIGTFESRTSASNAAALGISIGSALAGRSVPHFLHLPGRPNRTRLRCPQEGQL